MRIFQALLSSTVVSYPAVMSNSPINSPEMMRTPVMCSEDNECPLGTSCLRIVGKTGMCVLTIPDVDKDGKICNKLTEEDKESYKEFTGKDYDDM